MAARGEGLDLLFLTQTFPRREHDGAGPFIRDLAAALVRGGDRVTVLAPHAAGLPARWTTRGVEIRTFRYAPVAWEVLGYGRSLEADERVRWGAKAVAPLYLAGARRAVARALRAHRYDLLHAHWIVPNGVAAMNLSGRGSAPLAIGLHGSDVFLAEKPGVRSLVSRALRGACLLTGCSPELVERVRALGIPSPFPAERSRVIPYGVDALHFAPGRDRTGWRARLGIPAEAPLALGVGRMATKKGFHVLFEALPRVMAERPTAHVVLAGSGDLLAKFRTAAERWPGRVHLPGGVDHDTLPDLYRAADLFVLPAVHDAKGNVDGLPNVILEAMASALPVIATPISGIPLAVEAEATGLLPAERDANALAEALVRLLGDAEARGRMGENARENVVRHLTWPAIATRYRAAYVEALGSAAASVGRG